ncbi:hypothetical protein THAOC_33539, partial [Thalassiosira oceanica]
DYSTLPGARSARPAHNDDRPPLWWPDDCTHGTMAPTYSSQIHPL